MEAKATATIRQAARGYHIVFSLGGVSAELTQKQVKDYSKTLGLEGQELADELAKYLTSISMGYYGNKPVINIFSFQDNRSSEKLESAAKGRQQFVERMKARVEAEDKAAEAEAEAREQRENSETCDCGRSKTVGYEECYDCHIETMTALNKRSKYPIKF